MGMVKAPDISTTAGGAVSGGLILATVDWRMVPYGELIKILVALFLIVFGYFAYSKKQNEDSDGTSSDTGTDANTDTDADTKS